MTSLAKPKQKGRRPRKPQVGEKMIDGTIFAGVSPDTGKAMYATPADASLTMTFNEAKDYAAKLDAHGHKDWRVPTEAELNVLFTNRAAIGGFAVRGSDRAWYWSSTPANSYMLWQQNFLTGTEDSNNWDYYGETRVVRVSAPTDDESASIKERETQRALEKAVTTAKDGLSRTITVSRPFQIKKPPL